jgi:hypothetical protein
MLYKPYNCKYTYPYPPWLNQHLERLILVLRVVASACFLFALFAA